MSSSQPQKSDSSGPSTDGHPQGPLGGADQGERPQTPVATLCANSALPPQTSVALPSLPVFGNGMSLTSSSPAVPVPQASAGGHFFGGPAGPPGFAPCFPSPWQWSGMYGQMYGPSAFGGPAPGSLQPPPAGAPAFTSAASSGVAVPRPPTSLGPLMQLPPAGASAFGGSAPSQFLDFSAHIPPTGSSVGGPVHRPLPDARQPSSAQPPSYDGSSAQPRSLRQADASLSSDEDEEHDEESRGDDNFGEDENFSYSFSDALSRLSLVSPELVESAPGARSSLSAAERSLGCNKGKASANRLKESAVVTDAFKAAQDKARGGADVPEPARGSTPILSSALALGSFVKLGKLPQAALENTSFPTKLVPPTQEDLLLLGGSERVVREAKIVSIKDKALQDLSLMAGRGLEACSVMDSFLGGLVDSIKDPSMPNFSVKEEIDSGDVVAFVQALVENMKFAASAFSSLQVNITLARREGLLSKSGLLKKSTPSQVSLRAVPISDSHLFGGGHIPPTIHDLAEAKRDFAMALPRAPARSRSTDHFHRPSSSKQGGPYRSSRGRGSGRGRSVSSYRSGGGKPYERRQPAPKAGKQHPQ